MNDNFGSRLSNVETQLANQRSQFLDKTAFEKHATTFRGEFRIVEEELSKLKAAAILCSSADESLSAKLDAIGRKQELIARGLRAADEKRSKFAEEAQVLIKEIQNLDPKAKSEKALNEVLQHALELIVSIFSTESLVVNDRFDGAEAIPPVPALAAKERTGQATNDDGQDRV